MKRFDSIPRQEAVFKQYIRRTLKDNSEAIVNAMWSSVCEADSMLHRQYHDDVPAEYVSAYEHVAKLCEVDPTSRLFQVHR